MMKPKGQTEHDEGMLEYLEDIIGSCRLKEPIQIVSRRIELLNEQRGEKVTTHYLFTQLLSCAFTLFYFRYKDGLKVAFGLGFLCTGNFFFFFINFVR